MKKSKWKRKTTKTKFCGFLNSNWCLNSFSSTGTRHHSSVPPWQSNTSICAFEFEPWPVLFSSPFNELQSTCKMSVRTFLPGGLQLFIQTVKCSLFSDIIVYQSFYGALLTFSYFLLQGNILCFTRVGKALARNSFFQSVRRPCGENNISGYIWHKLFIQIHVQKNSLEISLSAVKSRSNYRGVPRNLARTYADCSGILLLPKQ